MKFNKIFSILAGSALLLGATACSSDYLDLKPEGTLDYEETLTNAQGASLAVNGMCQAMSKQYSGIDDGSLGFNGEPEIVQYYGEVMGQDYVSIFWMNYGGITLLNWTQMNSSDYAGAATAWAYCYYLISQANNLISFAPKVLDDEGNVEEDPDFNFNPVPDVEGEYAFRYAQALTFRAHAYTRLMQIYGSRYEDRLDANGNYRLTVPLRLEYVSPEGDLNCPLASWDELMNQIYADLGQAIQLYELSGMRRSYNWEPDETVAKGIFSRIALINHDWETARTMAKEAREEYPIMTMAEYNQGFAFPNGEWMWTNSGEAQGLYFWCFGATYACNGAYPCRWGTIGAGGIDNDLIKRAATRDQRAALYFSPRNTLGTMKNRFWAEDDCNSQTMNINQNSGGQLHSEFVNFCTNKYKNVQEFGWLPPYTYYGAPLSPYYTTCAAAFGAQFKFWGTDGYSTTNYPFMRGAEMLLNEAEAAYMMGDEKAADDLLYDLNSLRITNYNGTYNGEELLEAIKLSRRLELWGEGFSWFDFKRWNQPIVRTAWVTQDPESGNWPSRFAGTFEVSKNRGWRWRIPKSELNYNRAIDYSQATTGED